jgi:acyl-CoA synthetase (AMP-forming)/AMP-acid ligase II
MEAQVRAEDGTVLEADCPGELWLRGSLVTTGYAFDEQATREAVVDGWFDTGDIARMDADGYVTVLDRSKDMINHGGTKIFSAEVEALLRQLPGVEDAAVVGVPDRLAGEAVAAFLVLEDGVLEDGVPADGVAAPTAAQVRAWVRAGLADHAAPRVVELVAALPRNAVGKTDKAALRARLR